ncbi:TlpA family protein disulfide reductase [Maribacter sp. 2304DJ31-5]|uniref:TlpA family protein disulfide reductase n=1 Tax=Maribacter sp. 2304DJ31-5 TaxID=3386273 RepID=UPI0039BD83D2
MKKTAILFGLILIIVSACKKEIVKDYVSLSGVITNKKSDSLTLVNRAGIIKNFQLKEDGSFSDTLKIEQGKYALFHGNERTSIYLKNGYDLKLFLDTKEFDETITYEGKGAETNNYLVQTALLQEKIFADSGLFDLDKKDFDIKIENTIGELSNVLTNTKKLDSSFIAKEHESIDGLKKYLNNKYQEKQYLKTVLGKGKTSPKFTDYENYAGGTTSLDDLKGTYVYIDMWATWCGPCKAEIPFLKEVEKAYHGKNISFVSISIDRQKAYDTWRGMVAEKELSGIQLYAKEDETFAAAYKISGIPRFILIDPEGNIVNADAPRPSDPKLKALLDDLI